MNDLLKEMMNTPAYKMGLLQFDWGFYFEQERRINEINETFFRANRKLMASNKNKNKNKSMTTSEALTQANNLTEYIKQAEAILATKDLNKKAEFINQAYMFPSTEDHEAVKEANLNFDDNIRIKLKEWKKSLDHLFHRQS